MTENRVEELYNLLQGNSELTVQIKHGRCVDANWTVRKVTEDSWLHDCEYGDDDLEIGTVVFDSETYHAVPLTEVNEQDVKVLKQIKW